MGSVGSKISRRNIRTLVFLSCHGNPNSLRGARPAGRSDRLRMQGSKEELLRAAEMVAAGKFMSVQ